MMIDMQSEIFRLRQPAPLVFRFRDMAIKLFSLFLLAAGWFLVVAAIALLRPGFIPLFAVAGLLVELLGLTLLARAHLASAVAPRPLSLVSNQERSY
jgi:hypothetical protein